VKHEIDAGCAWEYYQDSNGKLDLPPNADDDLICKHENFWEFWKWFFNIVFLLELIWNFAGSLCKPFFADAWNWFDCLVVGLGVLDMLQLAPPRLKLLRMIRAFRIFRLFGRVESLRKILMSLVKSFAGLGNAGVIVLIVMCIYAVLAVDLFGEVMCAKDGTPLEDWEETNHHGDMCYGIGYFGSFVTSLYTMFQILTGESWSEGVVWPMLDYYGGKEGTAPNHLVRYSVMAFFTSFVIISQFILLNVVVTVLIDGMNQAVDEPTQKDTQESSQLEGREAILELLKKTQDDLDNMKKMVEAMPTSS
jgi:hypothetical protein